MTFPDNDFERLLVEAKAGRISGEELLSAMPDQIVYAPVVADSAHSATASFATTEIDGAPFVPAYSSEEQLVGAAGEIPRIKILMRELAGLLPTQIGIALNWRGSAPGLPIMPAGVARLKAGSSGTAAGSEVRIGEPARRPKEFLDALATRLSSTGSVRSARFGLMQVGDSQPVFVVGIDESQGTAAARSEIAESIAQSASAFALEFQVETYFIDPNGDDGFRHEIESLPQVYPAG
ncbi:enhanced serine sensitivity protein SseB C-terminal domain-containing protein [Nocardia acidivorans]|uniref:enhanced serine sensitivity protein SseB C-terminal domain-containing protein n=1 Tax=Nocardia acidivorans TaxID=404580 RepID=UPI00082E009D|nr:enhanced serine sensitivity protein SseB C-terminal domain-containing protein [Nocardia acidivorans]